NQNQVNHINTTTLHQPTEANQTEEDQTTSAHDSRKRKRNEAVSTAFHTNVPRPSPSSSTPLSPSTALSHSSSAIAELPPQFNPEADLHLGPEHSPFNPPPTYANHIPMVSQPTPQFMYGIPLFGGGGMFTPYPAPFAMVPALLNPGSSPFFPCEPISVFPQPIIFPQHPPMFFAQPVFPFPPPMISEISEAPIFQEQIPQPVPISPFFPNPGTPTPIQYVSDQHYIPSFNNALITSETSEAPCLERQFSPPATISTASEKAEQLTTATDTISDKEVKQFFQEQGVAYRADVFIDPVYQDKIREIWSTCPKNLLTKKESKEGKAYWNYLERIETIGDEFSLQALEIRKISIKLQNGNTMDNYGIFATKTLKKDTIIGIYAGELKPLDKIESHDYTFNLPGKGLSEWGIDAKKMGNLTRYINHSNRKNENVCAVAFYDRITPRIMFVVKKKAINAGEQLLYDYGIGYWKNLGIKPTVLTAS
ncbi:MAG: SET domain-containing protein-lysine N-methyltransferase, partial [Chlamydiales bacterium]|nr:SET domain-containing protein-lysine N-methyltransferase [Chlamydiales bacterium]